MAAESLHRMISKYDMGELFMSPRVECKEAFAVALEQQLDNHGLHYKKTWHELTALIVGFLSSLKQSWAIKRDSGLSWYAVIEKFRGDIVVYTTKESGSEIKAGVSREEKDMQMHVFSTRKFKDDERDRKIFSDYEHYFIYSMPPNEPPPNINYYYIYAATDPHSQYQVEHFQRRSRVDVDQTPVDLAIVKRVESTLYDFNSVEETMAWKSVAIGGYFHPAKFMLSADGTRFVRRIVEATSLGLDSNSPDVYYRVYAGAAINLRKSYKFVVSTQLMADVEHGVKSVAARCGEERPSVIVFDHDAIVYRRKDRFAHNVPLHMKTSSSDYALIKYSIDENNADTRYNRVHGTAEGITSYLTIVPGFEATLINICESKGRSRTEGLKLEHSKLGSNIADILRKLRIEKIDVFNIETNHRRQSEHIQKLLEGRIWHIPKRTGFEKQTTFFYQSDVLIEDLRSPLNLKDSLVESTFVGKEFIEIHLSYKSGLNGVEPLVLNLFDWVWKRNIIKFDTPIQAAAFIRGCLPDIAQLELVEDRSLVFLNRDMIIPPLKDADSVSAPPDGGSIVLKIVVGENAGQNIVGIHDESKIYLQHFFNDLRNGRRLFSTTIVLISEAQNEIIFC